MSDPDQPSRTVATPAWPSVSYEPRRWQPAEGTVSRRAREALTGEYASAITPGIADLRPTIRPATAARAEQATVEMTRFDAEAHSLFGNAEIAPITAALLRSESAASSQIEHLTVGARQLALAELPRLGADASRNAQTVSGNVRAMRAALALADDISTASILSMHEALLSGHAWAEPGRWRTVPVWIGGRAPTRATFVPPIHTRVGGGMDDLVTFARRDDIPALTHAAVAHAQFETIHPFVDGNGRTGRALVQSMLRRGGVTRRLTVPVSAGLLNDTEGYFAALDAYRAGDIEPIVRTFADAADTAVANGRRLVSDLHTVRSAWASLINARKDAAVWRALDVVIGQPVLDTRYLQSALGVSYPTAQSAIVTLENAGVLAESLVGRRRNRVWHAQEILDALDAFAERSGRRLKAGVRRGT